MPHLAVVRGGVRVCGEAGMSPVWAEVLPRPVALLQVPRRQSHCKFPMKISELNNILYHRTLFLKAWFFQLYPKHGFLVKSLCKA